jgi:hypothetical protein
MTTSTDDRKRLDWSRYAPLTAIEDRLLSHLSVHLTDVDMAYFNDFERQFISHMTDCHQAAKESGEGFYLSHKQRLTLWRALTPVAHRLLPPEMCAVFEQVSAVAAACSAR